MEKRRNRAYIIGLLVFVVVLTGVYALLIANLSIAGTATGTGDFKVEFTNYTASNPSKANVTIDSNNTSLTIDANLSYPGDSVTIDFTIKNTGSLKATVQDLIINENSTDDFNIKVNGINDIKGTNLDALETTSGSIVITWNTASMNPEPTDVTFDVTIDYIQAT